MLDIDERVLERDPFDPNDGDQPITHPGQVDPTLGSRDDEYRLPEDQPRATDDPTTGTPDDAPAASSESSEEGASYFQDSQEPATAYAEPQAFADPAAEDDYGYGSDDYVAVDDEPVESYTSEEMSAEV
jgi:hypothetical protein